MRVSCVSVVAGALLGCVLQIQAELVNGINAIVHDSIVTFEDVNALTGPAAQFLVRKYRLPKRDASKGVG